MSPLRTCALAFFLPLAFAGCTGGSEKEDRQRVVDELGRHVSVDLPPSSVASIAPSVTELIFAAGAGDLLVGASISDDFPPEVMKLPRFNTYPLDLEGIVALSPELVMASDQINHAAQVEPLARMGIPTFFFRSRRLSDIPDDVRLAGSLLGTSRRAEAAADSLERRMEVLKRRTSSIARRPIVLVLAGPDPLYSFGTESYVHELVDLAGGVSATASLEIATPILSEEFVLRSLPDVIVGTDPSVFSATGLLALHPTWDVVPAIRQERVYAVDPDLLYRPGPRLVEAAYVLASLLHPGVTSGIDP